MAKIRIKQIHGGNAEGQVLVTNASGENVWAQPVLGTPTDGSLTGSRYSGGKSPAVGLTSGTKMVDALDALNEVLGLLLPDAPSAFGGATLTLSTASGTALLANGATDNTGGLMPSAGSSVTRLTSSSVSTNVVEDRGDGMAGTIAAHLNGSMISGESFSFTEDEGNAKTTGVLRITDNKWTVPAGFYQTFDTQIVNAPVPVGFSALQVKHDVSGNSTLLSFVRDSLTTAPAVSNVSAAQATKTGVYSSGIEHYGAGSTFTVGADMTNLAGQTYLSGTIMSVSGPGTTVNFTAGQGGLPSQLAANTLNFSMSGQTFTIGGNNKTRTGRIGVNAYSPSGSGNASSSTDLLVLSGTGGLNDGSITGPTTTNRVYLTAASNNTDVPTALTNSAWVSTQSLAAAGYTHEAAIVGGVLRSDQTNYSVNYLPAGNLDYSSKPATQYVTYKFSQSARSSISITITGSYAGLWVAMPGISDNSSLSPNAEGGVWWNAFQLYNGSGVPGRSGQNAGCANGSVASGGNGTVSVTFGTASSTNATGNEIYIRIKLTAGQSITALSVA